MIDDFAATNRGRIEEGARRRTRPTEFLDTTPEKPLSKSERADPKLHLVRASTLQLRKRLTVEDVYEPAQGRIVQAFKIPPSVSRASERIDEPVSATARLVLRVDLCVWSVEIVPSYPLPNGHGDRKAIAVGIAGGTGNSCSQVCL